jgi:hypothetical protein
MREVRQRRDRAASNVVPAAASRALGGTPSTVGAAGSAEGWTGQVGGMDGTRFRLDGAKRSPGETESRTVLVRPTGRTENNASVTRALATATGDAVVILVSERAALRAELARAFAFSTVVALTA